MNTKDLQSRIESAWETRDTLDKGDSALRAAVETTIGLLDQGRIRVAQPVESGPQETQHPVAPAALGLPAQRWHVNEWIKKAVLLYFRLHDNEAIFIHDLMGYDKVPLKFGSWTAEDFAKQGARVVPPAAVRKGAYIAPGAILMPS
ncbi:MAG: hypothetical protein ACRETW_01930, partial [Stenotrophobium sp.]